LLGRGGERVGHRVEDVDATVAVEIDSVLVKFRRQDWASPIVPAREARMSASVIWPSCSIFNARRNSCRNISLRLPM
jgi:hypothetical protein